MPRENKVLQEGNRAPHFALPIAGKGIISLEAILEKGPLLLNFFRGTW